MPPANSSGARGATTTFLRTNNSVMKIASSLREHPAKDWREGGGYADKDSGRDSAGCFAGNIVVNILLSAPRKCD